MNIRPLLFISLMALLTACEQVDKAEQEKTQQAELIKAVAEIPFQQFDVAGLSFKYPKDWEITGDETQDSIRYIFIQGPKESVSIIQRYPLADAPSLEEFSNRYSEETQEIPVPIEEEAEASPAVVAQAEFMIINRDLEGNSYEWIVERVPGNIGGVETSDYREYFRKDSEQFATFLINQVSNDVVSELEGSFELIFKSLKSQP